MKMTKIMLSVIVSGWLALDASAATGESWKSPGSLSVGSSKTYTLVAEKNLDWTKDDDVADKYMETGSYYLKFTVSRGSACTLTVKPGISENGLIVSVDDVSSYDWDQEVYLPWLDGSEDPDGTQRYILRAEDWEYGDGTADDPGHDKKGTFYVYISGDIGDTCTVQLQNGEIEYVQPVGTEDNPYTLSSISTKAATQSAALVDDNMFYFQFPSLKKGTLYKFWTAGGTEDNALSISAESADDVASPAVQDYTSDDIGENDGGIIVIPAQSGAHRVYVSGDVYGGKFTLYYQQVAGRKLSKHPATDLGTPTTSDPVSAKCVPERRNDLSSGYYDDFIDDDLFKVTLKKGKFYRFWTSGSQTNLVMELYNADGDKLLVNRKGFATGGDCQFVYKAAASADYWVGVCQDLADDATSELATVSCQLMVQQVTKGQLDAFDNGDDTYTGASALVPGLSNSWKTGEKHGPHTLGATDWVDWYSIACRAGYTYKIGSVLKSAEDTSSAFALKATVYTVSAKGKKTQVATIADLAKGGSFTPTANGTHYIEVRVSDAQGVDYGPHELSCSVYKKDVDFGYLNVDVGGATVAEGAGWYLKGETGTIYAPGSIALPAGSYKVYFAAVTGWSAPSGKTMTVTAGNTVTLSRNYSDTCDPADDVKTGAVSIKPSESGISVSRSLWKSDSADWMRFTTVLNARYTFKLTGTAAKLGDATMVIYAKDGKTVLAEGTEVSFTCREAGLRYYAVVMHANADAPVDSQYVLSASYKQVGAIGFAKTEYSVADEKTYVSVKVTREDGTSGKVSVRCSTVDGEAKAGDDFVPVSKVLTWADGDSAVKTVKVELLPKLRDVYKGDRSFALKLELLDTAESELGDDEVLPIIAEDQTSVTITDSSKIAAGTLQFVGTSDEWEDAPTSTKSSASVKAGERVKLWFSRQDGTQGEVGLLVNTADSTAKNGVNYCRLKNKSIRWADGDDALKCLLLETTDLETAYQDTLKLTVSAKLDSTAPTAAALGAFKTLTVSIADPRATKTFVAYQTACTKLVGISVKSTGTWYFDESGTLCNVTPAAKGKTATLTLTLTGPGKLAFSPSFMNGGKSGNTATYSVDKGKAVSCAKGQDVELFFTDAKAHTVVFTVKRSYSTITDEISLGFSEQENGLPFLWVPLRAPTILSPFASEALGLTPTLRWSDAGSAVSYRLNVNTTEKYLGKKSGSLVRNLVLEDTGYAFEEGVLARNKKYYARVDALMDDGNGGLMEATGTVFTFTTAAEVASGSGTLKTLFKSGLVDAWGEQITEPEEDGMPYEVALVQGVSVGKSFALAYDNSTAGTISYALVDAKKYPLPDGLKLSKGKITGYPTTVGSFTTLLQATQTNGKTVTAGETLKVTFTVTSQGVAAGTFNGLVTTEDEQVAEGVNNGLAASSIMPIAVSVSSKPKADNAKNITATVKLGGESCTFTAPCWSRIEPQLDNGLPGAVLEFVCVTNVYRKANKAPLVATNRLTLVTTLAAASEDGALDGVMDVRLEMTLPTVNKLGWATNVVWTGSALRKNTSYSSVKTAIAPFAGYYTVSLAAANTACGDNAGMCGNGYLTMQVTTGGTAKYAGVLGDGVTKFSGSAVCNLRRGDADGENEIAIPVYYGTSTNAFGGWLRLKQDSTRDWQTDYLLDTASVPVVCADTQDEYCAGALRWIRTDADNLWAGEGFVAEIEPVGGYYDTTVNLQRYYYDLYSGLALPADDFKSFADEYLSTLLGSGECLLAYPGMEDDENDQTELSIVGNTVSAAARALKYRNSTSKLIDWSNSVNPCNLSFTFTRATGIYSGTAYLYKGNGEAGEETKKSTLAKAAFGGVLLFATDSSSAALDEGNVAPGTLFATSKTDDEVTRTVNVSVPLKVLKTEKTESWREALEADE